MSYETLSSDGAICPYCGHMETPADSDYTICDEDLCENECPSCGKEYKISVYKSFTWNTDKINAK